MDIMTIKNFKEESNTEIIKLIMKLNNGYVTLKDLDNYGIHKLYLNIMRKNGNKKRSNELCGDILRIVCN